MRTKTVKWFNSLGLRIPKSFTEEVHVAEGTTVELLLEHGRLVNQPVPTSERILDDLLAGVTEVNTHGEVDLGGSVGGEHW